MKRLIVISCSLLIFFAGLTASWASCKRISFASDRSHGSPVPVHKHDHQSSHNHDHSRDAVIHCNSIEDFVPVATFSVSNEHRVERIVPSFMAEFSSHITEHGFRLIHGPPC